MALADVAKAFLDSFGQMSEHIEGAILYLDSGCTESFQFAGVFPILLDLGVRAVCSLENLCSLDVIVHSAYPDSPLGPDAFREYESLLLQDYEELIKKRGTKSGLSKDYDFQENTNFEDERWSHLTSSEEEVPHLGAASSAKIFSGDDEYMEDAGQKLVVSVHHFPMIFCPLSPRVFVLPSEGSVAEACLSIEHEDSISLGLPPISSGVPPDGDDVPPGALLTAHFLYHLAAKLLNGSLVSTETFRGTPYMEAIFDRRTKDGALLVRKWLQETLRRENIAINVKTRPGFATKSELKPMIETLAKSQSSSLRNKGIIQLAAAVLVALDESHCARWDALTSAEKY
ncbi:hypothetical protein GH714_009306 [Hevea brasiliensis]|uniref:Uncharacterized protein n=1 Tax=Hevea brasiliensis TaxID=3981 RepID=A0A6A6L0F5_HEVBR|nr:hypothetical protein GH714_009306 [Hevea brasiliensis]